VGDDAGSFGGDEGLPAGIRWRAEAGDRIVEVADEPGDVVEAVVGVEQGEGVWPSDGAGDEGEDFAAELVQAQRPGAPWNPAACRWPSRACTVGVHGPAGRRTVSPIRTTPPLTFPLPAGSRSWRTASSRNAGTASCAKLPQLTGSDPLYASDTLTMLHLLRRRTTEAMSDMSIWYV